MNELKTLMSDFRKRFGLSQDEAAAKVGISRVQWGRIETGACACRSATAQRILRGMGTSLETAAPEDVTDDADVFDNWMRCPVHGRQIPIRKGEGYCARCGGWFARATPNYRWPADISAAAA
ncbi:MAG: helix-turn-helix transcriptional regulator [Acidobacteria bacterium]|nr:helix-turn-helix transcriptional regulator [Acidobacteriota bacterium]